MRILNVRTNELGTLIRTHPNGGVLTATGASQDAYTVDVNGKYYVWLEKTDYVEVLY